LRNSAGSRRHLAITNSLQQMTFPWLGRIEDRPRIASAQQPCRVAQVQPSAQILTIVTLKAPDDQDRRNLTFKVRTCGLCRRT
jgi:hypothetical protein